MLATAPARSSLVPAALALGGAAAVLLAFVLPIAYGESVVKYLTHYSEWGVFFVYSPIELVPAVLAAAGVGIALLRGRIRVPLAGGVLLGVGVLVVATAVALLKFFDLDAAVDLVPLVGGILLVPSGVLLVRSAPRAARGRRDSLALWLGIAGAVSALSRSSSSTR